MAPVSSSQRRALVLLLLALSLGVLAVLAARLTERTSQEPTDFIAFWSAGRLIVAGENPYDPAALLAEQRAAGWTRDEPQFFYYPPWALTVLLPFSLPPHSVGAILFLFANLAIVFACAAWLWALYGGPVERRPLAWTVALTFLPTLLLLANGQAAGLVLAGIVGFLALGRRQRWFPAGAALSVASMKPHVLILFWVALALWAVRYRRWRVLAGGVVAGAAMSAVPLALNPGVLASFLAARQPFFWATPTIASLLRLVFGPEREAVAFVPTLLGLAWLALVWHRHGADWSWPEQSPMILAMAVVTAPYTWTMDLVLLLPALMQGTVWVGSAGRQHWDVAGAYGGLLLAAAAVHRTAGSGFWLFWLGPALLGLYVVLRRRAGDHPLGW